MAQTTSVQKGSFSNGGSNNDTVLFTLSGGTATRVISCVLAMTCPNTNQAWQISLTHNVSGAGRSMIGYGKASRSSVQFIPTSDEAVFGMVTSSTTLYSSSWVIAANTANTQTGSINASSIEPETPVSGRYGFLMPRNFWMANGDQLIVNINAGGQPVSGIYEFICVTES
jgi:hypothetical protein